MLKILAASLLLSTALGGCAAQLSPPQIVGEQSSDVAVREFLFAGQILAQFYGLDLRVDVPTGPAPKPTIEILGIYNRPAVPYVLAVDRTAAFSVFNKDDRFKAREYFIRAGHHASQIICRNYLSGLRDRNEYFEFVQQEFKIASNLTSMLLTLSNVAEQSKDIFTQVVGAANIGADSYQSFKFLAPEIETILPLVEAAQVAMRNYYVGEGAPATFAGALNAVSKIEYQCSRSGIRAILTKTLVQSKPQYNVVNGVLYAIEAKDTPSTPIEKPSPASTKNGK